MQTDKAMAVWPPLRKENVCDFFSLESDSHKHAQELKVTYRESFCEVILCVCSGNDDKQSGRFLIFS